MTAGPLISVIIAAHQTNARPLADAIRSVLTQTCTTVEAIVIPHGSGDHTTSIANAIAERDDRVHVHPTTTSPAAARNAGMHAARGSYLTFLRATDRLLPHALERHHAALAAHPYVDLVYGDHHALHTGRGTLPEAPRGTPPLPFRELLAYRTWFAPFTALLRTSLTQQVGPFDDTLDDGDDRDYWYRCAQATAFLYQPGIVGVTRAPHTPHDRDRNTQSHLRFADKHFANDPRRKRRCLAAMHLQNARSAHAERDWRAATRHLAHFAWHARTPTEARNVWSLP